MQYLCDTFNEHSSTSTIHNYRCRDCGSVFVGNNIDTEELAVAYASLDATSYYREIEIENRRKMAAAVADLRFKNELSWPVARYVRVYLLEKQGLPVRLAPALTAMFHPFLASNVMNANKAIVSARKPG